MKEIDTHVQDILLNSFRPSLLLSLLPPLSNKPPSKVLANNSRLPEGGGGLNREITVLLKNLLHVAQHSYVNPLSALRWYFPTLPSQEVS